jgi:Zn-dependent peptidase ImmA (M78 family)
MISRRDAVLDGVLEAARLHEDLDTQSVIDGLGGRVDPFAAILDRGGELLFRQLDGFLGLYLPKPRAGILVTTERSLAIQRYTASHELGHFVMGHRGSIDDDEILRREPSSSAVYDPQEIAANAFASAFLLPDWIIEYHAVRQDWTAADLADPINVYQLSLRVGASYEATCRTLLQQQVINPATAKTLLSAACHPKKIKQKILGKNALKQWHPNVWILTGRDQGAAIHGEPDDLFVVRLTEHVGSGYLWDLQQVGVAGFKVITDERLSRNGSEEIGGAIDRIVTAQSDGASVGNIDLQEIRPWDLSDVYGHLSFAYDFRGREHGLPRAARERLWAA